MEPTRFQVPIKSYQLLLILENNQLTLRATEINQYFVLQRKFDSSAIQQFFRVFEDADEAYKYLKDISSKYITIDKDIGITVTVKYQSSETIKVYPIKMEMIQLSNQEKLKLTNQKFIKLIQQLKQTDERKEQMIQKLKAENLALQIENQRFKLQEEKQQFKRQAKKQQQKLQVEKQQQKLQVENQRLKSNFTNKRNHYQCEDLEKYEIKNMQSNKKIKLQNKHLNSEQSQKSKESSESEINESIKHMNEERHEHNKTFYMVVERKCIFTKFKQSNLRFFKEEQIVKWIVYTKMEDDENKSLISTERVPNRNVYEIEFAFQRLKGKIRIGICSEKAKGKMLILQKGKAETVGYSFFGEDSIMSEDDMEATYSNSKVKMEINMDKRVVSWRVAGSLYDNDYRTIRTDKIAFKADRVYPFVEISKKGDALRISCKE